MPFSRASSLDRLLKCAGGAVLPQSDTRGVNAKVAADWGTMVHGWKEDGTIETINDRANLPPLFEKKLRATGVRREAWWPESMIHEVALAVKPLQAYAELRDGGKAEKEAWKAGHGDEWSTGTLDGYDWMFDVLWIDDLKTGRLVTFEEYQDQLRLYALGLSRVLDYRGPVHTTLTWWPRYPVLSMPVRFGRVMEQDELMAFEKRLVDLRSSILRGREDLETLKLVTGDHCTWCPSRMHCPAVGESEEN